VVPQWDGHVTGGTSKIQAPPPPPYKGSLPARALLVHLGAWGTAIDGHVKDALGFDDAKEGLDVAANVLSTTTTIPSPRVGERGNSAHPGWRRHKRTSLWTLKICSSEMR
jgi:hypothetical protein